MIITAPHQQIFIEFSIFTGEYCTVHWAVHCHIQDKIYGQESSFERKMLSYIYGSETYLRVTFLVSELLEDTFQYQKYSSRGNLSSI